MWFPGRWDKGWHCSRAETTGEGHREGDRESSEAPKPAGKGPSSTGRQRHIPAPREVTPGCCRAPGSCPRLSGESVEMLSKARAVWIRLLRITNAANNSQEATGPSPGPRPEHAAGTRRRSRIPEPPQNSLPGLWTSGHMGQSHQSRDFRSLRLSPNPIQAGQEQNKNFPWTLSRPFIFKEDPVEEEEEEDLWGDFRHLCLPQPHSSARGQSLGPASCWGWEGPFPGAVQGTGTGPVTLRKAMRTGGINKHMHRAQHLDELLEKGKDSRG